MVVFLRPVTISLVELLLNPLKKVVAGGMIPNVLSMTLLGIEPIEPDIPMVVGCSLLCAIINLASSLLIFSISCKSLGEQKLFRQDIL